MPFHLSDYFPMCMRQETGERFKCPLIRILGPGTTPCWPPTQGATFLFHPPYPKDLPLAIVSLGMRFAFHSPALDLLEGKQSRVPCNQVGMRVHSPLPRRNNGHP